MPSCVEYSTVLQLALNHTYDSPCSCGTCISSLGHILEEAGVTIIISMRSANHAYKSGECHLGRQCIASSDPCCHASPLKSTPAAKCRDGVNAALNASKKAPVWCSIYKDPDYAGRGGRRVAGVMDSTWRSRSRGRVFGGGLTIAVCDSLTGWSVLRLLSQFVRLLCRRKARSAHTHFSIPVQSRFPAVPHLFLSLGLCFALTYLQFYALAGSQDLALKVEGAAVLGVVHVE